MYKDQLNEMIAKKIILAQACSDGAKFKFDLLNSLSKNLKRNIRYNTADAGKQRSTVLYNLKLKYELEAIKMITSNKRTGYQFYVTDEEPDQNGSPSVISYFEFVIEKKLYQVSFHTPKDKITPYLKSKITKGTYTEWTGSVGGSRDACKRLMEFFEI